MDLGKNSPPWLSSSLVYEYENSFGNKFDPRLFDKVGEPPPVHILYPRPNPNASQSGHLVEDCYLLFLVVLINCIARLFNCP